MFEWLQAWIQEINRPAVPKTYHRLKDLPPPGTVFLMKLGTPCRLLLTFDSQSHVITHSGLWLHWLKYHYWDLKDPEAPDSYFFALYHSPVVTDGSFGALSDQAYSFLEAFNASTAFTPGEYFAPSGVERGVLKPEVIGNVNQLKASPQPE